MNRDKAFNLGVVAFNTYIPRDKNPLCGIHAMAWDRGWRRAQWSYTMLHIKLGTEHRRAVKSANWCG